MAEFTIGILITTIVGVVLVSALRADAAFVRRRALVRPSAESLPRDASTRMPELRIVEATGGVEPGSSARDVILRVPYAYGLVCSSNGHVTTVSLLPVDSAAFAAGVPSGFAWRDDVTGAYTYITEAPGLALLGTKAACARAGIGSIPAKRTSPAGRVVDLEASVSPAPSPGSVLFLYRRVRYQFPATATKVATSE
jgi:hypothetical protein